ncbi:MAG: pentapeptide repeat-containing protein [Candidatus Aminicenantes bacterium]|nr:pentapeptide repeat-containing protein [Candidatus Aminicenantes bacterium]
MKAIKIFLVLLLAIPIFSLAQSRVQAEDIIDQINAGKDVSYKNAVIVGDLDFRNLDDVTADEPLRKLKMGRLSSQSYSCHVRSSLSFIDCTFEGDVLAYISIDRKNDTYNAVFYEDVDFEGCVFEKASAFKYAKFKKEANFENTTYEEEALFKYAQFSTDVSFQDSIFNAYANFKYVKFPETVDFKQTVFRDYADFKYAKFPEGVSFEDVEFQGTADFKYTKFSEPLNLDGVEFEGNADFKYTKIDGRSFTSYLIKNKR